MKKVVVLVLLLASLISLTGCTGNVDVEILGSGDLNQEIEEVSVDFLLDNENKYLITTDMKWMTMRNDGGSHTNVYYQIDLNTGMVKKCEDEYVGFKGYEYEGKVINKKTLDETEKVSLQGVLDSIIVNVPEEETLNYNYYELELYSGDSINIYDKETINEIVKILE